jgi:hypothetical protein
MCLKGQRVQFAVRDIYFPGPESVLKELHGEDLIVGDVLDVSDNGLEKNAFVVVKVERLEQPVVVPAERIRNIH